MTLHGDSLRANERAKEMFPRARKLMDKAQLLELGQQLAQAKESLRGARVKELVRA